MSDQKFLVFSVAGTRLALPLLQAKEVLALPNITPVPKMPPAFRGLMNVRGTIHPVVDLRLRLGKPGTNDDETAVILLGGPTPTGAVVDSVDRVVTVGSDQINDGSFLWENELICVFDAEKFSLLEVP